LLDIKNHILTDIQKGVTIVLIGCEIIIIFGSGVASVKSIKALVRLELIDKLFFLLFKLTECDLFVVKDARDSNK